MVEEGEGDLVAGGEDQGVAGEFAAVVVDDRVGADFADVGASNNGLWRGRGRGREERKSE